jgi:hypothetical protein
MHLIIFSTVLTPRIKYIFSFLFKDILKVEVEFTGNSQYFIQSTLPKISYGEQPLADELFFKSTPLLFANKVEEALLKPITFGDYQVPFAVQDSALPFDVFAASFFIVSRYEEYLFQKKTTEEFKASKSLQHKWKILKRPIIDEWALMLKNLIRKKYPDFKFHQKHFSHHPTINFTVNPSLPKGFVNKSKFLFSAFFQKRNRYLSSKFDRLTGVDINNEQVLNAVTQWLAYKKTKPLYFVNFPDIPTSYLQVNGLSKSLSQKAVGLLRPCADSPQGITTIKDNLIKLKKIHPELIHLTSQQLEVLKFPICYLNLLSSGFISDFSMGYADTIGFRAGTCTPFNWYDLQLEKATTLKVNAYCMTDQALQFLPLEEGKKTVNHLIDQVKVVNGTFYSTWQLRSLSDHLKYKKLKTLFTEMLQSVGD